VKILDYLKKDNIVLGVKSRSKKKLIEEIVSYMVKKRIIAPRLKKEIIKLIMKREAMGSTGIGQGVALPHCRTEKAKKIILIFANSKEGVEFNALDNEPVNVIFFIIIPDSKKNEDKIHEGLELLSKLSKLLKDRFFRKALTEANTEEEVIKIIKEEEGD